MLPKISCHCALLVTTSLVLNPQNDNVPLDVEFKVFRRRLEMKARIESSFLSLSASLVKFETLKTKNDELWNSVVQHQVPHSWCLSNAAHWQSQLSFMCINSPLRLMLPQAEFWTEMSAACPSLARLGAVTQLVDKCVVQAIANFDEQLALCGNSVQVHRRYAQFLLELANDPVRADKLLERADELETLAAKDRDNSTMVSANFLQTVRPQDSMVAFS